MKTLLLLFALTLPSFALAANKLMYSCDNGVMITVNGFLPMSTRTLSLTVFNPATGTSQMIGSLRSLANCTQLAIIDDVSPGQQEDAG